MSDVSFVVFAAAIGIIRGDIFGDTNLEAKKI